MIEGSAAWVTRQSAIGVINGSIWVFGGGGEWNKGCRAFRYRPPSPPSPSSSSSSLLSTATSSGVFEELPPLPRGLHGGVVIPVYDHIHDSVRAATGDMIIMGMASARSDSGHPDLIKSWLYSPAARTYRRLDVTSPCNVPDWHTWRMSSCGRYVLITEDVQYMLDRTRPIDMTPCWLLSVVALRAILHDQLHHVPSSTREPMHDSDARAWGTDHWNDSDDMIIHVRHTDTRWGQLWIPLPDIPFAYDAIIGIIMSQ